MRAVLDTNVVVSGLLWDAAPERLLALAGEGVLEPVTSQRRPAALAGVLGRPKCAEKQHSSAVVLALYTRLVEMIEVEPRAGSPDAPALRDPDGAALLACAIAARAVPIVSGDADLLTLRSHQGIPILSPAQRLARLQVQR